ncbi:hypothetical protein ACJQWK_02158 [Exserohilum turcicum]
MDPLSNQDMPLDSGHDGAPIEANSVNVSWPTTSDDMPANDTPQHHNAPMTPDISSHPSNIPGSDSFQNLNEPDKALTHPQEYKGDGVDTQEPQEHWRSLVDFDASDSTQLDTLYKTYLSHYGPQSTATNATRMQYGKAIAFASLKRYYPASQGYKIEPASLGPVAKSGVNFILAAEDQSDVWKDLPVTNPKAEAKRKKKRRPSKYELRKAAMIAQANQYNHGMAWTMRLRWDRIEPHDIAAFVVERKREVTHETTGVANYEWVPYTYLGIIIENYDQLPQFSSENVVHRSDILVHALCQAGNVQEGYGILLYGPRLEFYSFRAGQEWAEDSDSEDEERDSEEFEPKMQALVCGGRELAMDLRDGDLRTVDEAFNEIAGVKVVYRSETKVEENKTAGGE